MADLSRRTFLGASAAAAAGAAVIGVPLASAVASTSTATPAAGPALPGAKATGPLVVYVPDAAAGDVNILLGTDEVTYHDPELVARLARAAARTS
jgi:hypothetical protein